MPYRELTLTPTLSRTLVQPGDVFPIDFDNSQVLWIRGAAVLGTFAVTLPGVNLGNPPPVPQNSPNVSIVYYQEVRMPGTNVSITNIRIGSADQIYFNFSDGSESEIADLATLEGIANAVDADSTFAKNVLMAMTFRASPDGSNLGSMIGAQVAVNCAAGIGDPVVYTAP